MKWRTKLYYSDSNLYTLSVVSFCVFHMLDIKYYKNGKMVWYRGINFDSHKVITSNCCFSNKGIKILGYALNVEQDDR